MLNISKEKIEVEKQGSQLNTLNTLSTPRNGVVLSRWLVGIMVFGFLSLFLPWQQNITGYGSVTAFDPKQRPQTVQSAIAGRIVDWKVREGQFVLKGDTIVVLAEIKDDYFDPEVLTRINEQVEAKANVIEATKQQIKAIENQLEALNNGLRFSLEKARNKLTQARLKLISDSTDLIAQRVDYNIAKVQFDRFEKLFEKDGLISLTDLERRKLKLQETAAKLVAVENKFYATKNEVINANIELNSLEAEYREKISKAQSDLANKIAYLADSESEYSKLRNKYRNVEIRTQNYYLTSPQDGYIVKALRVGIGETIKEGEAVVSIQPDSPDLAVEIYVRAMDVPLISKGRKVRIEFDGWPALQFSGWPSVAVGTFGGEVAVIDYVNSPSGEFRILVVPDKTSDGNWPRQLRLGSGVFGWVMLDDVPVWYEIWRQLNGFPPSLQRVPEVELKRLKSSNGADEKKEK
jgi:multidrug resistance efflux pump